MPKITRPETLIEVGVDEHYCGAYGRKVRITFKAPVVKFLPGGGAQVDLDKQQTTQLIKALKSQRKRKNVR